MESDQSDRWKAWYLMAESPFLELFRYKEIINFGVNKERFTGMGFKPISSRLQAVDTIGNYSK